MYHFEHTNRGNHPGFLVLILQTLFEHVTMRLKSLNLIINIFYRLGNADLHK